MVYFPQSRNEIEDLSAHLAKHAGLHRLQQQAVSVGGLDVGSMDFNPSRHSPHLIDPLAVTQDVFDTPQVRLQLPSNPMIVSLVGDYRFGSDLEPIRNMKTDAVDSILKGLVDATPSLDRIDVKKITEEQDDNKVAAELLELCSVGLCIVVSDFRKFALERPFSDRADVLALKVNHPAERAIMANVGTISLGGIAEINTNNPAQVQVANAKLEKRHFERMQALQRAGAKAGAVLVAPNLPLRIDPQTTDAVIASLVRQIQ